jgi:surface carbohydrate biosynthesis protein
MAIYIRVEVARREFDGRLLLALVAAERGHEVVLGKISLKRLMSGNLHGWRVSPGVVHLKSAVGTHRLLGQLMTLRHQGFVLTAQDEEHGLNAASVEAFGPDHGFSRYPEAFMAAIERCFSWGELDDRWLQRYHSLMADRIVMSGSPRIDLWRPEVNPFEVAPETAKGRYVLIVSSTSPFAQMPFWVRMFNERGIYFHGDDDPVEFAQYEGMASAFRYIAELVRGVRRLARAFPDVEFIVRPHHFEIPEAWEAILGDFPNVRVDATGPSLAWARDAAAIVHGGSTLAFEATVAGRPVISFNPNGDFDAFFSDAFGLRASSVEELVGAVGEQLEGGEAADRALQADASRVRERLAALDGRLAADRIVDEWERLEVPEGRFERVTQAVPARVRRRLSDAKWRVLEGRRSTSAAQQVRFKPDSTPKFPPLDMAQVLDTKARLSATLDRFHDVEILPVSTHDVLVRLRR